MRLRTRISIYWKLRLLFGSINNFLDYVELSIAEFVEQLSTVQNIREFLSEHRVLDRDINGDLMEIEEGLYVEILRRQEALVFYGRE